MSEYLQSRSQYFYQTIHCMLLVTRCISVDQRGMTSKKARGSTDTMACLFMTHSLRSCRPCLASSCRSRSVRTEHNRNPLPADISCVLIASTHGTLYRDFWVDILHSDNVNSILHVVCMLWCVGFGHHI